MIAAPMRWRRLWTKRRIVDPQSAPRIVSGTTSGSANRQQTTPSRSVATPSSSAAPIV